jgi:hypothetical protein
VQGCMKYARIEILCKCCLVYMTIYAQDTEVINGNSEKLIKEKG